MAMLIDGNIVPNGKVIETDLCILGAGAAGISIATEFLNSNTSVCLIESGSFEYEAETQNLYNGEALGPGLSSESNYLNVSRLRYFGGTTNHWNGWCRPLDEHDFKKREWVSNSGWPIKRQELNLFYNRACKVCEILPFDETYEERAIKALGRPLDLPKEIFETKSFHFSPPTRFGQKYKEVLMQASNVSVFINSNIQDIVVNETGSLVKEINVKTLTQNNFLIRAKHFVLALGGIENARLLLISNKICKSGLGNQNDLVGRFFMEHPHVQIGRIFLYNQKSNMNLYRYLKPESFPHHTYGLLFTSASFQEQNHLLNFSCRFEPYDVGDINMIHRVATGTSEFDLGTKKNNLDELYYDSMILVSEQEPNPASRVILSDSLDALGQPKISLEWKLTKQDYNSIWFSIKEIVRQIGLRGMGRIQLYDKEDAAFSRIWGGCHHMGTTRMCDDPSQGVVNQDCKVYNIHNLFIAGSSVFPTGGCVNPTLTIVALALRLADHLKVLLN